MALTDNKRGVFTSIGSYSSYMQQNKPPKKTDSFTSINNKKDSVPFLLDVLKVIVGTDGLKEVIGGMFTKVADGSEVKIKTALKKQFTQSNSGEPLPAGFINNGVEMKCNSIDTKGKLKISPNSDSGDLLYNKTTSNFDSHAHDALVNGGTTIQYPNMNMNLKYNESSDSFNIKPTNSTSVGEYFNNYIDNAKIVDKKELVTNVMDGVYGTLSNKNKKTQEQILDELQVQKLLDQVLNQDDSFIISPNDYDDLQSKSIDIMNGVINYDMSCGIIAASLPFNSLNDLVTVVSGSTNPFLIANAIEGTIDDSTTNNVQATDENRETIKDGFFQKIIKTFTNELLQAATTQPQIRMLLTILNSFQNGGQVANNKAKDDMKNLKIFIKCMAKEIITMISEFIFNLAISYLIVFLTPVIKKIAKEKINQFIKTIKSLTGANKISKTAGTVT